MVMKGLIFMRRKKLTALLTSLSMIASLSTVTANAVEFVDYDGFSLKSSGSSALLVQTDGTAITEEMITEEFDWIYRVKHCLSEVGRPLTEEVITENTYLFYFQPSVAEEVPMLSRALQLECDWIEDLHLISEYYYQHANWTYEFYVTPADLEMDMTTLEFPELAEFEMYEKQCYDGSYRYYMNFPDGTAFQTAMEEANLPTYYDEYLYMEAYGDAIAEKYSAVIADVYTGWIAEDLCIATEFVRNPDMSIWQSAGDPNADGAVTAEDAADLLITAAEIGTGASIKATSAEDVNADGSVSADDAAAVLCYAAAQGSGNPLSWVDILRK